MHILMKGFMEGLGASKRSPTLSNTKAADLPSAKPFTEAEFQQLAALMGGVNRVAATQASGNG